MTDTVRLNYLFKLLEVIKNNEPGAWLVGPVLTEIARELNLTKEPKKNVSNNNSPV